MLRYFKSNTYIIVLLASIVVVLLGFNTYDSAKNRMIELSNKNKIIAGENIIDTFQAWFDERINSLIRVSEFMENSNLLADCNKTSEFLDIFAKNSKEFDAIQLQAKSGDIWIGGKILPPYDRQAIRANLIWYAQTKDTLAPTVNFMPKHAILEQETLNFCVPNFYKGEFSAALCGIVKLQSLFEKIKNFKLSPNSYSFIITNGGEILTPMKDHSLKLYIQDGFKELYLNKNNTKMLNIGSNFISFSEIKYLNWFVGAGVDNKKEIDNLLSDIGKNAALLLCGFLALSLFANSLHNFMYNKINARKKEYEILLMHRTKMSEIGELLSGINHQFIQPVNSLRLITTTIKALKKDGHLSDEKLEIMLKNQEKSIMLLSDTIEIFRNFYKTNENISKFSIKRSIKNLLTLMHTELSRANVSVVFEEFEDRNISQIENIIQQILLILIHNAKDAVVEKFKDDFKSRVIYVSVKFDERYCYIEVSEFGCGVDKRMRERIFDTPKTTKEFGSGIGLYFGKKLANEKISGDLKLLSVKDPTVFCFRFAINLKEKDE